MDWTTIRYNPSSLNIGDRVTTTATLNVRSSAALGNNTIATLPKGSTGTVLGGPETSGVYTWWRIAYDAGSITGWSEGDVLHFASSQDSSAPAYFSTLWVRETIKWTENYYTWDNWTHLCLQFAANAFMLEPNPPVEGKSGWHSAYLAAEDLPRFDQGPQGWLDAPKGALILFLGADGNVDGHVGIYLGDGKMVHAYVTVKANTVGEAEGLPEVGPYIGWSYPPEEWQPDLTAYELKDLEDIVNRRLQQQVTYPSNLLNAESFPEGVTAVWTDFTSWITRTNLKDMYYDFYLGGINYDGLRVNALIEARRAVKNGNLGRAQEYLRKSETYERLSNMNFQAANEVFLGNLDAGETIAQGIEDGCQASVKFGLTFVNPEAAKLADVFYDAVDFGLDSYLSGEDEAVKNFVIEQAIEAVFNKMPFEKLGGKTLSDWMANRTGKLIFPELSRLVASQEFQWAISRIVKEAVPTIAESVVTNTVKAVVDKTQSMVSTLEVQLHSPGELRVYDSVGQVVGVVNGAIECQIPQSMYCDETVVIFCPQDTYHYEVVGTGEGTYGLEVTWVLGGTTSTFNATDIPIALGAVHHYAVDWSALSQGEQGATLDIDSDGDGAIDTSLAADAELTHEEFLSATAKEEGLPSWIWIAVGAGAVAVVVGVVLMGRRLSRKPAVSK
ncbi:MAG: hypothetical protein NTZ04_03090 [Chloroflexi bacterium]|nr:hypothetical protein [Chloroflexota bacterium]